MNAYITQMHGKFYSHHVVVVSRIFFPTQQPSYVFELHHS